MINPLTWQQPEKLCVHRNDADHCILCRPKPVSNGYNANIDHLESRSIRRPAYIPKLCKQHGFPNPCLQCDLEQWVAEESETKRRAEVRRINEVSSRIWAAIAEEEQKQHEAETEEARRKLWTCEHGLYLLEKYCDVCAIKLVDSEYNRDEYRAEINNALKAARTNFRAGGYYAGKDAKERLTEDEKNFQDLLQLVDLEVWKASRHYGDKMNGAIAASVAKNVAGKFTSEIIEDQTVVTDLAWAAMPSDYRERVFELYTRVGGLEGLVRLSKDSRDPEASRAKSILREYGFRAPRFESFDLPTQFANGTFADGTNTGGADTSAAECKVHQQQQPEDSLSFQDVLEAHRPSLELLVKSWRGDLQKVGQAVLAGTFNTREIPGVSRNSASRLQQRLRASFPLVSEWILGSLHHPRRAGLEPCFLCAIPVKVDGGDLCAPRSCGRISVISPHRYFAGSQ